jgi:hypothetical protein
MSWFIKLAKLLFVNALLATFTLPVLAQVASCDVTKGYLVFPANPSECYYIAEAVLWLGGPVKTTVTITNTTTGEVQYDLIPSGSFWYSSNNTTTVSTTFNNGNVLFSGNTVSTVEAGKPDVITFLGTTPVCNNNGVCQPGGDSVLVQLYIRVIGTPDLLDQQQDNAIVITTAYAPDVVTTALPWSLSATSVRRNALRVQSMGNFTETLPGSAPMPTDKHNIVLVTNTGVAQQMQVSILDNDNNVITQGVTRELATDELYVVNLFQMFGTSMLPGGVSVYQGRVSVQGLDGGAISTQTVELDGAPYATITQPTWPVGQ